MPRPSRFFALLTVLSGAVPAAGAAASPRALDGPIRGAVERVIDGDTVKMRVAIWIDQELTVSVRVAGVDAPELFHPRCAAEREKARAAKAFVEAFVGGGDATLYDVRQGKYAGRVVARIETGGRDLGQALVAAGHAVSGAKGDWCAGA